jgi:hypothetical protein
MNNFRLHNEKCFEGKVFCLMQSYGKPSVFSKVESPSGPVKTYSRAFCLQKTRKMCIIVLQ